MPRTALVAWTLGLIVIGSTRVAARQDAPPEVVVMNIDGPLTPATAEYLDRTLGLARDDGASLVVVQLDTPGGSVDVMNRMIQAVRASRVPVAIYVAPRGAMAASAGTLLVLSGHVAAMAPETTIGAASPVGPQGEDLGNTLQAKTEAILRATVRSLAAWRGAPAVAMAESAVGEASASSNDEALAAGMVDLEANDLEDLLLQLNGRSIPGPDGPLELHLTAPEVRVVQPTLLEQLLQALTNPNFVFLLLSLGVQAILIEISHPGGWVAGFVGVLALALGAYGLGILPVNWFGLIFIVLALVLFVLDLKAPTHGALTAAGLGSFILGALVLFNSPGTPSFQRVSVPLVVGVGVFMAALFALLLTFVVRAQRRPVVVGATAIIGRVGEVRQRLSPRGQIQVAGELWAAEVEDRRLVVEAGERVEVTGVDGLRLKVRPREQGTG